jgi:hypothetical protein
MFGNCAPSLFTNEALTQIATTTFENVSNLITKMILIIKQRY